MKKKSKKNLICDLSGILMFLTTLYRCYFYLLSDSFLMIAGWILGYVLTLWVVLAFKYDKDVPGVGPYSYDRGNNQLARGIYFGAVVTTYVIACIHG